jgi:hypothetical protein
MAYTVPRRTREMVALGAGRSKVVWLVMQEVSTMAAIGISAGLPPRSLWADRCVHSCSGWRRPIRQHSPPWRSWLACRFWRDIFRHCVPRAYPSTALRYE